MKRNVVSPIACLATLMALGSTPSILPARDVIKLSDVAQGRGGFVIEAPEGEREVGFAVAAAGDVNGDGLADLLISNHSVPAVTTTDHARLYVVFGKRDNSPVSLANVRDGSGGFVVEHPRIAYFEMASSAGDVNSDGLGDILIGANEETGDGRVMVAYALYGKRGGEAIDLSKANDGSDWFGMFSNTKTLLITGSVGCADMNGDGSLELIVGTNDHSPTDAYTWAPAAHLVPGRMASDAVDLDSICAEGSGSSVSWRAGPPLERVSSLGDFNGDGLGDVGVMRRIYWRSPVTSIDRYEAESQLLYGRRDQGCFFLDGSGSELVTRVSGEKALYDVAGLGDMTGDGLDDLGITAIGIQRFNGRQSGRVYLVFGRADRPDVQELDPVEGRGFVGLAENRSDEWPDIEGLGDVNGDGRTDFSYTERNSDEDRRVRICLSGPDPRGADSIPGIDICAQTGTSGILTQAQVGDINGDGLPDTLVCEPRFDGDRGGGVVVFSRVTLPEVATYRSTAPEGKAHRKGISDVGNLGFPDSRTFLSFDGGDAPSTQTVEVHRDSREVHNLPGQRARTFWQVSTNRTGFASATVTFKYLDHEISGIRESSIHLYRADSPAGPWLPVTANLHRDPERNLITGTVHQFGYFALSGTDTGERDVALSSEIAKRLAGDFIGLPDHDRNVDGLVDAADLVTRTD
jgi:hypothetical protein